MLTVPLPHATAPIAGLDHPSWIRRAMLIEQVAGTYADGSLTLAQRRQAEDLFRIAIYDHETLVRSVLADSLKRLTQVPRDIVLSLARDEAEVARPLLRTSAVLDDDDLAAIAHEGSRPHRLAITERDGLSAKVAQALCQSRDPQVIRSLIANETAALPEALLHGILDALEDAPGIVEAMERRRRLPASVANRLAHATAFDYMAALRA
jgi:uncharacterized protein (DUF2336 family)